MNVNIEELITIDYELEGLLYLAVHRGDDTPKEVWSLISDKIKSLNEGISPAVENDDVDTDDTPGNAIISCNDEADVTVYEQPEIEEPEIKEEPEIQESTTEEEEPEAEEQPEISLTENQKKNSKKIPLKAISHNYNNRRISRRFAEPEAPCQDIEQVPATEPEPIAEPIPETTVEIETVEPEREEEEEEPEQEKSLNSKKMQEEPEEGK